jgi:HlyD family secretion protein
MKTNTKIYAVISAVAILIGLGWAFAPRAIEVEVATVNMGPFESFIEEDGRTRLRERYIVSAPLAGRLGRISLREGDAVDSGTIIATLTPVLSPMLDERTRREQNSRVETAQAQVALAMARVGRAKVSQQQAETELRRTEQLSQQGFIAPTKLDTDRLTLQATTKEWEAARQQEHMARHELDTANAALIAIAQTGATSTRGFNVHAPTTGRILRIAQTSEATVNLGTPLLEIGDVTRMEVIAELLTTDALSLKPGARVVIDRWGGTHTLQGRIRLIEPSAFTKVSALGVEEQRVNVLIDITSPPEQWRALGDGYRVSARVIVQSVEKALQVPVSAVFPMPATSLPGSSAVFTIENGKARLTPVELGARNGTHAWIKSGLSAGTQVIVYPPTTVRDAVRVKPRVV